MSQCQQRRAALTGVVFQRIDTAGGVDRRRSEQLSQPIGAGQIEAGKGTPGQLC